MGDVISSHLDESRRHYITERTGKLLTEFGKLYEVQYGVALFNSVRYEIEGNGGPQTQLLHRKAPLKDRVIFSGNLFQYIDDTKKWRNRFCLVPHHYGPVLYENKTGYERGLQPRAGLNCAGYRVLTSLEQYSDLLNAGMQGGKLKTGSGQMKSATQFAVILWHPYCQHYQFCVMNEQEQQRWSAVFQDCVRHCNNGIPEDLRVESAAFTDSVRLFRQTRDQYGTWDMLCGNQVQVLSNLVMEDLNPDLKNIIFPKLRGKPQERQRVWLQISDTVYRMVHEQARLFYEGLEQHSAERRAEMESQIRTDMDQIISCKEHVSSKIRAAVLPKAELCVRNHVQSHIPSILDALMVPTSQGFSEVRDLLFRETTEMNMNLVNEQGKDKLGEHMDKLSQLAYHPVKMQPCYEKMEQLHLEGLQQRFDVGSPAVFRQRAQILMREQTDNAVYTLEQLVHQELSKSEGGEDLCKDIQRVLERVLKKYDYDSSSVRKKFFQEALLQILIPFLLKKLAPTCRGELPRYQELIFEELSRYVLVENTYEEVVLQTVMRDIMQAVKDAATQRKHNLYRDSMVMHNSDPNLHLLGEGTPIDWSEEFADPNEPPSESRKRRARQVVSLIQDDEPGSPGSCQEAPAHESIPEEGEPSDVVQIRGMLVKEFDVAVPGVPAGDVPDYRAPEEEVTGKFEPSAQTQRERLPGDGQGPQEEEVDHCDTRLVQKEKVTHEDLKVAPEALARGDLKVALDTMEHHDLHVAPEALAHHDLQVAPEALAHRDLQVAPEALAHHDLQVAPEALAHHDLQVAPEALAHHDLQVAPEALAHRDLQVVPEALAHRDLQVAPEALAHRDLQVAPEAMAHSDLQVAPEALAHRDLQVAPESLAHHDLQVAWRCHASQEDAIAQPRAQTLPCEMPAERITPILTVPEEESQSLQTQLPPAYLVHSTPDDSGFQSPLSEEEEGEGLREVPVPVPRHKDEVITPF